MDRSALTIGKGSSAPPPREPDPGAVAAAQTSTNVSTAIANAVLGNANVNSPLGRSTFTEIGTRTVNANRYDRDGNVVGTDVYEVPRYQQDITLSPEQQVLQDQQSALGSQLNQLAMTQAGNIDRSIRTPLSLLAFSQGNAGSIANPYTQKGFGYALPSLVGRENALPSMGFAPGTPQNQSGYDGNAPSFSYAPNAGTLGGAPTDLIHNFSGFGGAQANIQGFNGPQAQFTSSITDDFGKQRDEVTGALMSRIQPSIERDREALGNRLAVQGFAVGSDAYNQAMDEANRTATDARMQAILAGGQEQSRISGLAFQNAALGNNAEQARFQNALNTTEFNNSAEQQAYLNQLGTLGFNNSVVGANNDLAINVRNMDNAATQGNYANAFQNAGFNNAAAIQDMQNRMGITGFNNAAAAQNYQNQVGEQAFNNAAMQQDVENDFNRLDFNNKVMDQRYAAQLQELQMNNAAMQQNFANSGMQWERNNQTLLTNHEAPINEIASLMGQGQVTMPQFQGFQSTPMQPAPYGQYVYQGYNTASQNYQAEQNRRAQAQAGMMQGIGSIFGGLL